MREIRTYFKEVLAKEEERI